MQNILEINQKFTQLNSLNKIFGGKDIYTTMGDGENPSYSDVHHDRDNDGQWSMGDSYTIKRLR